MSCFFLQSTLTDSTDGRNFVFKIFCVLCFAALLRIGFFLVSQSNRVEWLLVLLFRFQFTFTIFIVFYCIFLIYFIMFIFWIQLISSATKILLCKEAFGFCLNVKSAQILRAFNVSLLYASSGIFMSDNIGGNHLIQSIFYQKSFLLSNKFDMT